MPPAAIGTTPPTPHTRLTSTRAPRLHGTPQEQPAAGSEHKCYSPDLLLMPWAQARINAPVPPLPPEGIGRPALGLQAPSSQVLAAPSLFSSSTHSSTGPRVMIRRPPVMGKSNSSPKYVPFSGLLCLRAAAAPQSGGVVPVCYLVLLGPVWGSKFDV